jgi:hypothetical protein
MSETPMDDFNVGDWVIQSEPFVRKSREPQLGGGFSGMMPTGVADVVRVDRSYMDAPHRIVGVDLPHLVIEAASPTMIGERVWRSVVDVRERTFRRLTPAFVAAYLAPRSAP